MKLEKRAPYRTEPTLRADEELVEFREATSDTRRIPLAPGEFAIGIDGRRYQAGLRGFAAGNSVGRYIVRKRDRLVFTVEVPAPTTQVHIVLPDRPLLALSCVEARTVLRQLEEIV